MCDAMIPTRYRVIGRREETSDVVTLDLEPVDVPIADPQPGQFTMLYAFGAGEVPVSVSGLPSDEGVLRHTVRAVGATTRALCRADVGQHLGVRGPFGRGWSVDGLEDRDVVVVGGGVGLAPLRAAVRRALAHRGRGRLSVLAGARTPNDLLFASELDEWHREPGVHAEVIVDAAGAGWDGRVGLVTELITDAPFDPTRTVALVCGPEVMMRFVARAFESRGVDPTHIEVSLERSMHCAIGRCGHCLLGPVFVCTDGPVFDWVRAESLLAVRGR